MESPFATPGALVEALHNRVDGARARLWDLLRDPVRRLMEELKTRHQLEHKLERMTEHALHAAETFVRTRPLAEFAPMSVPAFRAAVLLQVAKQGVQPFGDRRNGLPAPDPLPESDAYVCRTLYLPYEKVGSFWYGGDWYGGRVGTDGSLWVIVADITGHGYCAYLLANTLPSVWRACWSGDRLLDPQPSDVLGAMHDLLQDCLPDGVYAECTLLRLAPEGSVMVAPAGGSRLLLRRRGEDRVELVRLRGLWLGLDRPLAEDQQACTLAEGDELLIGTDGAFDQLIDYEGSSAALTGLIDGSLGTGDVLGAMQGMLERALQERPQKDDITLVMMRRQRRAL